MDAVFSCRKQLGVPPDSLEVHTMIILSCPDVLTVMEAAEVLRVGRSTMYKLVESGEVQHIKIGRKVLIPRKYLQNYIEFCPEKCYNIVQMVGNPSVTGKEQNLCK